MQAMFDKERNGSNLTELSVWSKVKIHWKCKNGHSFATRPEKIYNGQGCPFCSGRYATKENNLSLSHPHLLTEWDYDKNRILPSEIKGRSGKTVYWKCKNGHSWEASCHNRATGQGCPFCSNKKVDKSNCLKNDNTRKWLLDEWDYDKNTITPFDVTSGSTRKVWWRCENNHCWEASIRQRSTKMSMCPHCNKIELSNGETFDSYAEASQYIELIESKTKFVRQKKYPSSRMKSDFYIPEKRQFIEVTSFKKQKHCFGQKNFWFQYLRKIARKKKIAEKAGFCFKFIQISLSREDIERICHY